VRNPEATVKRHLQLRGEPYRTDQVRQHHRDLAALGDVVGLRLRYGDGYR
jgi:hypothetical protein